MELLKPSYQILTNLAPERVREMLSLLETAGRVCYKSEENNLDKNFEITKKFITGIIKRGHESVIEHQGLTVKFICDRGVSHEIVRHRLCSFSQESTRYCNYGKKGVKFIITPWVDLKGQIDRKSVV